jgi:hypothetical protein
MINRHRVPRPPLARFIELIWLYESDPRPHTFGRILPTGAAQLIVNLKRIEHVSTARAWQSV